MSAIMETEPGDVMVVAVEFYAPPQDRRDAPRNNCRRFRVGERVRFVSYFRDENLKDHPYGWMAVIEPIDPADRNQYVATDASFVTCECWNGLRKYFARALLKRLRRVFFPRSRKASSG